MAQPLGIGILGTGSISIRGMLPHLTMDDVQDRVRVTAVCDIAPGRAQAAAERFGVPAAYEEYAAMLADPKVDLIGVATPIGQHYEQGVQAVEAGKHVYFNKTMTTTVAEADDLIERAARKGVKLVASPGQLLHPMHRRIREMIRNGDLGPLAWTAVGAAFGQYHEHESVRQGQDPLSNVDPSWYYRKPGGGPLYDMTVYGLHAMTGVLGPAKRVTAMSGVGLREREFRGKMVPCDMDDNTVMLLDFGSCLFGFCYGTFAGSPFAFGQPSYFGTKGTIAGSEYNGKPLEYPGIETARQEGGSAVLPHVVGPHRHQEEAHVYEDVMQLVDWVLFDKPPVPTAEHARHVIDIFESAYRSAQTGKTEELRTTFEQR